MEAAASAPGPSSSFPRRNPRIPEDTVFYAVYPELPPSTTPESSAAALAALHISILRALAGALESYIWQHEPFHLSLPSSPSTPCRLCDSPSIPHLHGKTKYGDNLDDEWFIVFLLYEISRSFPSLSARVWDSDGEFLLIEAAFSLPRWINPENSKNRVFIRNGELHILPRDRFPSTPTLENALKALDSETRASDSIQSVLGKRISAFPEKSRANMHQVRARVPLPVAHVLKHEPCLISLAVEGFYDRDVDSMKHAAKMEKFLKGESEGEGVEMVRVSVRMTRVMYGQLMQQRFQAPRCFPMPRREEGPAAFAEAELGLKIACGFEMMYQERQRVGGEGKGGTWDAFRQSLESSGYFRGLLPGSKEYNRMMESARVYYQNSSLFSRTRDIMNAPIERIAEILALPHSVNDFKDIELPPNDDDSWLCDGEDELNSSILERQTEMETYELQRKKDSEKRKKNTTDNTFTSESHDFNLGDIAETMQAFVQKLSSFEGAEIPHNRNSKPVELDADQFMKDMESVLGPTWREESAIDANSEEHTSSSDMDFDDSDDERELADLGEDNIGDAFLHSYSDALNEELNATTLGKSFSRAAQQSNRHNEATSSAAAAKDAEEDLTPVDVDLNLVKSFLDSFSSQQGLPGPASNLLGLMGLEIPPDKKI